jgi:hypothetical protein
LQITGRLSYSKITIKNFVTGILDLTPAIRDLPKEYYFSRFQFFSTIGIGIGCRFRGRLNRPSTFYHKTRKLEITGILYCYYLWFYYYSAGLRA